MYCRRESDRGTTTGTVDDELSIDVLPVQTTVVEKITFPGQEKDKEGDEKDDAVPDDIGELYGRIEVR